MKKFSGFIGTCLLLIAAAVPAYTQIAQGGNYAVDQGGVTSGGGTSSDGGGTSVSGAAGQPATDSSSGGNYRATGGMFAAAPLAPTAAGVSIKGRVRQTNGLPVADAVLTLTGGGLTAPLVASTSSFGFFSFEDVEVGHAYVLTVSHMRYGFASPTQIVVVNDPVEGLVFEADWDY